jgi:hypothetical protein
MKMAEKLRAPGLIGLLSILIFLSSCTLTGGQDSCDFSGAPAEDLFRASLQHLEIIDAESGEVATYDSQGNPVLEGGQPLALWAEFETPTSVELCVMEADGRERVRHRSEVTFSNEITMQPLGRYDIGSYRMYISMNGTLVNSIEFVIR